MKMAEGGSSFCRRQDMRVLRFGLFILLENGFIKFIVIVLLIRFPIRLIKDSVEL